MPATSRLRVFVGFSALALEDIPASCLHWPFFVSRLRNSFGKLDVARAVPRTSTTKAQNEGSHEKEGFKAEGQTGRAQQSRWADTEAPPAYRR
jgi:hypothetical protein